MTGASPMTSVPWGGTKLKVPSGTLAFFCQPANWMRVALPSWSVNSMRARPLASKPRSAWSNCGSLLVEVRRSH